MVRYKIRPQAQAVTVTSGFLLQMVLAIGASGSVYAAIRADLAHQHERSHYALPKPMRTLTNTWKITFDHGTTRSMEIYPDVDRANVVASVAHRRRRMASFAGIAILGLDV